MSAQNSLFRLGNLLPAARSAPGSGPSRKCASWATTGRDRITGEQLERIDVPGSPVRSDDEHRFDDLFIEDVGMCSPVVGETEAGLEVADDLGSPPRGVRGR